MYRLLLLLLLAGCVKEKIEHQDLNYAIDNGLGWQGMYEYLTPQEEGFSGMEGAPDGVIAVFHGYKDTSELRGYTIGIPNDPKWQGEWEIINLTYCPEYNGIENIRKNDCCVKFMGVDSTPTPFRVGDVTPWGKIIYIISGTEK